MGVHRCFMDDDGCFKTVIRGVVRNIIQGCLKGQGCFIGVLRVFYGCFKALKPVGNVFWYASKRSFLG